MRVLYATRSWSSHDDRFTRAWRDLGHNISTLSLADAPESFARRLTEVIHAFHPDVVHAGPLTDVAHTVATVWNGPFIAMSWGFDLMDEVNKSDTARVNAASVVSRADQLVVDNDALRRVSVELGADPSRIVQFPWGVDLATFTPSESNLRTELGWTNNEMVVLSTRRHEPLYDVVTVVEAFTSAAAEVPELRLLVAGGGSQTESLTLMLRDSGLSDRVQFLGEIAPHKVSDVYRSADLYVSASTVDGSSVSLLEAMACGIPVCVSAIEGNMQWIAENRGDTFPVGDSHALATLITHAADQARNAPESWARRGDDALAYVRTHASWTNSVELLGRAAETAIDTNRRHA